MQNDLRMPINKFLFIGLIIAFWNFASFMLILPPWNYLPADPGWVLLPLIVHVLALMIAAIDTKKRLNREINYASMNPVKRIIVKYVVAGFLDRINGLRFWGLFIAFTSFFYILILQNYFTSAYEFSLPASLNFWVPFIILILGLVIASIEREMSKS